MVRANVLDQLAATRPRDTVLFAQLTLTDLPLAWTLAHELELTDDGAWSELAKAYEKLDPLAVLPVLSRVVDHDLANTGAAHYRAAARRLARMRRIAAGTDQASGVDALIAELRQTHRRRPRLQQEFDRAGLPWAWPTSRRPRTPPPTPRAPVHRVTPDLDPTVWDKALRRAAENPRPPISSLIRPAPLPRTPYRRPVPNSAPPGAGAAPRTRRFSGR